MKSRNHEINSFNHRIALKFDRHIGSQQCRRCACQMSEHLDNSKYKSRFETLRDLTIRRLIGYWNEALVHESQWTGPLLGLERHRPRVTRCLCRCLPSVRESIASTMKPVYNDHIVGYFSAFWSSSKGHLDELQKAEIVSKSKLVPSVLIKTHYWLNQR